jgi:protein gp37
MAQTTKIEWTDISWNPVHGCSKVSAGCNHCYAETLSLRRGFTSVPWTARNAEQNVTLKPHKLREPLSRAKPWDKPCRVFVNSMSDLFHEQIPYDYIGEVFRVMERATKHTFQVLTKRPERMAEVMADLYACGLGCGDVLPNVWLGVSIENRKWVGRADILRETPAAVRFISAEPLLGPLVGNVLTHDEVNRALVGTPVGGPASARIGEGHAEWWARVGRELAPNLDLTGIDWLIVGGESGSGHRPFDPQWARDLRDACRCTVCHGAGEVTYSTTPSIDPRDPRCETREDPCGERHTAFFMKQTGGARAGTALEDLPEDLRIREFPVTA